MAKVFELTKDRSAINGKYYFNFIENSQKAIVPILQKKTSDTSYRLIGTGSYIIEPNIFITAKYIFEGQDINSDDAFYIILEDDAEAIHITGIHKYDDADIAIFTIEKNLTSFNPLAIMNLPPEKHEIVAVFGFSHSIVDQSNTHIDSSGNIIQTMQLRSKWELGGVAECHESGRGFVTGPCFETSILAEGRDSGAPLFNSNGFVIGVLSSSMEFEEGLPNSICTAILQIADIPINEIPFKNLCNKTPSVTLFRK